MVHLSLFGTATQRKVQPNHHLVQAAMAMTTNLAEMRQIVVGRTQKCTLR